MTFWLIIALAGLLISVVRLELKVKRIEYRLLDLEVNGPPRHV